MKKFNYYPVLIDGEPYNLVVRSSFTAFVTNDFFQANPNTVTIFIENKGTAGSIITINNIQTIAVGEPGILLGGDSFMRRDDRITIVFSGVGTNRCVITSDIVKGLTPLKFN